MEKRLLVPSLRASSPFGDIMKVRALEARERRRVLAQLASLSQIDSLLAGYLGAEK